MRTIDPDRPNRMDDVFCIQGKGRGVNGLTRCNVAYLFPRGDQLLFARAYTFECIKLRRFICGSSYKIRYLA